MLKEWFTNAFQIIDNLVYLGTLFGFYTSSNRYNNELWFDRTLQLAALVEDPHREDLDRLGELLRNLRAQNSWTRRQFSIKAGVPINILMFVESNSGLVEDVNFFDLNTLRNLTLDQNVLYQEISLIICRLREVTDQFC